MNDTTVEEFKKKHLDNYKNAVAEILKNNSTVLFEDDVMSLLKKPPLDSMDLIKCKFLDLAKKHKLILNAEHLDDILDKYRRDVISTIDTWKNLRIQELEKIIFNFSPSKESDVIKLNKKDFISINKKIRKLVKDKVIDSSTKNIVNNVNLLFTTETKSKKEEQLIAEVSKFLITTYPKQLLEGIDFKILVKDTTLINGIREQSERYMFTKMNSYLLNDKKLEAKK